MYDWFSINGAYRPRRRELPFQLTGHEQPDMDFRGFGFGFQAFAKLKLVGVGHGETFPFYAGCNLPSFTALRLRW